MSDDEREEKELDLTSPEVVTKYKSAAEIVNSMQTGNMYKNVKRKIERGVAFPTCISVNNTVCHFSPLASDESLLEEGDMLKIDMGCQERSIEPFFSLFCFQYQYCQHINKDVTEAIQKVAAAYDCCTEQGKVGSYSGFGREKSSFGFSGMYPYDYWISFLPRLCCSWLELQPTKTIDDPEIKAWLAMGTKTKKKGKKGEKAEESAEEFVDVNDECNPGFEAGHPGNQGGGGGSKFGGFGGSTSSQSGSRSSQKSLRAINSQIFKKEIVDQGMTWLLLSYTPSSKGIQYFESTIEEVSSSLQGALKIGSINCEKEVSFCKEFGISPRRAPRVFVYSYKGNDKGSLVEYNGDLDVKNLKAFCQDNLPRFSKRTDLNSLDKFSAAEKLPSVMLLSTKKDTPVIWRVLITFIWRSLLIRIDVEVHDVSDPRVKRLGVDALPAIVGWLPNGEKHILKTGISVKDIKSAVHELGTIFDSLEKTSKKASSGQTKKAPTDSDEGQIQFLSKSNFETLCGDRTPVCIIGVFRTSKAREKLQTFLSLVSQKSFSRQPSQASGSRDSISYSLLDATKQPSFLKAFDKTGFKSSDMFLIAYKPKRRKFTAYAGEMTIEEVENFISSVLNGDIPFRETREKPILK
ncbi:dnaJ protein ERDJ3A [Senna tora]|uniref:DnaJ protein ERDJ3A n=1 Tax=Senna tora TaxID=362788 RepID=A0A835CNA0_9FABA|nr:dnaJ protein ERDJ3A [Senna tora]